MEETDSISTDDSDRKPKQKKAGGRGTGEERADRFGFLLSESKERGQRIPADEEKARMRKETERTQKWNRMLDKGWGIITASRQAKLKNEGKQKEIMDQLERERMIERAKLKQRK